MDHSTFAPSQKEQAIKNLDNSRDFLAKYKLTKKQYAFICEYINNGGNGTQAALAVYSCKNKGVAAAVGSEFLTFPKIKDAMNDLLYNSIASPRFVLSKLHSLATTAQKEETQLGATNSLAKVHGLFQDSAPKSENNIIINLPFLEQKQKVIDIELKTANLSQKIDIEQSDI